MAQAIFTTSVVKNPVIATATTPILSTSHSCLRFLKKICNINFILKAIAMVFTAYIGYKIGEKIYDWLTNRNQTQKKDNHTDNTEKISHMEKATPQKEPTPLEEATPQEELTPLDLFLEEELRAHETSLKGKTTFNDIRILLIGKTGDGLSSTGNSILGEKIFKTKSGGTSQTTEVQVETRSLNGHSITVADSPSIIRASGTTNRFIKDDTESMRQLMKDLLMGAFNSPNCQEGFDAIVFVLRFGRPDNEQAKAIKKYKEILGSDVFQKHVILVFTGGDNFKSSTKDEITFEQWFDLQSGDRRTLLKECDYRCVLFDNKSEDTAIQNNQRKQLKEKIDRLRMDNGRYVKANYQKSVKACQGLLESQLIENITAAIDRLEEEVAVNFGNTENNSEIIATADLLKKKIHLIKSDMRCKKELLSKLESIFSPLSLKL